jgi:hypothetical protein
MSDTETVVVRLGPAEWARFTRHRETEEFELIGSVRSGASMGALAVTPDGRYLQVNGDYVSELNGKEVERAVQTAAPGGVRAPMPRQTPVVVIKRRRSLASA